MEDDGLHILYIADLPWSAMYLPEHVTAERDPAFLG